LGKFLETNGGRVPAQGGGWGEKVKPFHHFFSGNFPKGGGGPRPFLLFSGGGGGPTMEFFGSQRTKGGGRGGGGGGGSEQGIVVGGGGIGRGNKKKQFVGKGGGGGRKGPLAPKGFWLAGGKGLPPKKGGKKISAPGLKGPPFFYGFVGGEGLAGTPEGGHFRGPGGPGGWLGRGGGELFDKSQRR